MRKSNTNRTHNACKRTLPYEQFKPDMPFISTTQFNLNLTPHGAIKKKVSIVSPVSYINHNVRLTWQQRAVVANRPANVAAHTKLHYQWRQQYLKAVHL